MEQKDDGERSVAMADDVVGRTQDRGWMEEEVERLRVVDRIEEWKERLYRVE